MFSAEDVAKSFKKSFKGLGTDEKRIIKEMIGHNNAHRQLIKVEYLKMYGKTLEEDLKSEISGHFLKGCLGLLMIPDEYEATCLYNAMKGLGTDEKVMIELLCTKSAYEIRHMKQVFTRLFKKDLEKEVADEQGGDLGRVFRSIASGTRDDSLDLDIALAKKEAQELYDAGQGKMGTDEIEFIRILCSRNFRQLNATFEAYQQNCGTDIEKAIKKEFSGKLEQALLAIVKSIRNKPAYFAELMHNSMKGLGTKDDDLVRLLVSRAEVDLPRVQCEYQRLYGKSLYDAVKSELSGDYKRLFLALIELTERV